MYKENFRPSSSTSPSQESKAEELGNRFRGLVNEGLTHGQSSAAWLNQFKLKHTPPKSTDVTIGFEDNQYTAK